MKLFLSLFLSVCISLSPLYSSAEIPDLMPVYKTDQMTVDQSTLDSQLLFEKMKAALSHPNLKAGLVEIFNSEDMQTAKARLSHDPSFQEDILTKVKDFASAANVDIDEGEARALLNDSVFIDEQFAKIENNIANLDEEKLKDFQNTLNSESFTERQSSEQLIAQLNHNIDQMVEVDHAPGSMAMLGAGSLYEYFHLVFSFAVIFAFSGAIIGALASLGSIVFSIPGPGLLALMGFGAFAGAVIGVLCVIVATSILSSSLSSFSR